MDAMARSGATVARRIAQAASAFQRQATGHAPTSVTAVLGGDRLVVTPQGALSPAEKALARDPTGTAQVQEFHRQLFANASASLRQQIKRITGAEVREATAAVAPAGGTMVQVFLLARSSSADTWSGNGPRGQR